jgi:HSP20 family protein
MSTSASQVAQRDSQGTALQQRSSAETVLLPPVDIFEDGDGITLEADMPGVSKEHLNVHLDGEQLLLEGEVRFDLPEQAEAIYADVRSTIYRRSFVLSRELQADKIQANLKDGVLKVRIPKSANVRSKKIAVQSV